MPQNETEFKEKYSRVEDRLFIRRFLRDAAESRALAILWTKEQAHVFHSSFNGEVDAETFFEVDFPEDVDDPKAELERVTATEADWLFNVFVKNQTVYSFTTSLIEADESSLRFKVPTVIFKLQRRKDQRFEIPAGYALSVYVPSPLPPKKRVERKLVDISSGGLSFFVPENEAVYYKEGLILDHVRLTIQTRQMVVRVEVRHAQKPLMIKDEKWVRVGVAFRRIRPEDHEFISAYVTEHLSQKT